MRKSIISKNGLIQFRSTKEKPQEEMQTVCCLGQKRIRQCGGSEMSMDLLQKIHGRNQK